MTDLNKTLIAALLDRSGSMETSKEATEEGWRKLVDEQRALPGSCRVTLAQFDTEYEVLYSGMPISDLPEFVVQPRGGTALLDAIGRFVTDVGSALSALPDEERPGHVICMIMTDGMENSSRKWSLAGVRKLVEQQLVEWNWKFLFLGANMDAVDVAGKMGIGADDAITYNDGNYISTVAVSTAASAYMTSARAGRRAAFTDEDRRAAVG